jgi:hypothetical protein
MKVNYEELKKDNLIAFYKAHKEQIEKELKLAERDLRVSKNTLDEDEDK